MQNSAAANALDSPLLKPTASSASTYEPEVSEESLLVKSSAPQIHLFKSQVILNPTISRINFVAYLFFTCYNAFILIPVGLLQMPLLKIHYGMSQPAAINASTILQLLQLGYKTLIVYPILGAACDKYGRKPFIVIGVIAMNVAIFLSPNLPAVYPYWILDMILQDLGMTCLLIVPLIADYIDYETKGRVAGIASVLVALMAFISSFITSAINVEDNIPTEYHAFGIGGLVVGLIICLGIKGGPYHKNLFFDAKAEEAKQKANQQIEQERIRQEDELNPEETIRLRAPSITNAAPDEKPGFKVGIKEAQRNPWILLGYLANFLFFSEIMLVNALLVNYVNTVTGTTDSTNQAYDLTNKQALVQVFGGIFFGFAADKLNKFKLLMFIVISSIIAVVLLIVSPSPYNFLAYLSMVFFGISLSGFLTFVTQVTSKYPTPKFRASVMAVSSMCGLVGSALTSILGMFLSQFDIFIPFYIYLGAASAGLFALIVIYIAKRDILNRL